MSPRKYARKATSRELCIDAVVLQNQTALNSNSLPAPMHLRLVHLGSLELFVLMCRTEFATSEHRVGGQVCLCLAKLSLVPAASSSQREAQ